MRNRKMAIHQHNSPFNLSGFVSCVGVFFCFKSFFQTLFAEKTDFASKVISGLIITVISFNAFIPKISAFDSLEIISKVSLSGSVVADFFYHSSIPMKIVENIVSNYFYNTKETSSHHPKNDQQKPSGNSSDSFITGGGSSINIRGFRGNSESFSKNFDTFLGYTLVPITSEIVQHRMLRAHLFYIFMLMILFLLPRSNTTVDKLVKLSSRIKNPIWINSNWVFSIYEYNLTWRLP